MGVVRLASRTSSGTRRSSSKFASWQPPWPERYNIVLCCFLATLTAYVERVGFSIAYTAMAKAADLDEALKGTVLSAFYWGYALSQIPGGWAAQRYGGRIMLIMCFLLWSLVSLACPTDARAMGRMVIARVSIGVAQGFLIPAVHTVLSQWIPPHERARAVSLTTSGMYLGSAAAMLVLPTVAALLGAPALLTVVGVLGLSWLALWLVLGREIPHRETVIPLTTSDSLKLGSSGAGGGGGGTYTAAKGRPGPTPWQRMACSPAVWAIVSNNFAFHYAFYVIMNWLPTYFNSVLRVELATLGPLKTLPYLVMFLMSNVGGWAGDYLIHKRHYSVAAGRKAVNTVGFIASAGALMLMPGAKGVGSGLVATSLTLGALGLSRGGFSVNHMDIAPKYAGVVMGFSNTAGTLAGVIGVWLTGVILDSRGGSTQLGGWYAAHILAAVVCGGAMLVFNALARGERLFD